MLDRQDRGTGPKRTQQVASAVVAPPCAMVIFGAAGDLTKRLVVPALYNLANDHQSVRRISNSSASTWPPMTAAQWRAGLTEADETSSSPRRRRIPGSTTSTRPTWQWLTDRMSYLQGDLNDPETYRRLGEHLAGLDKTAGTAGN